MINSQGKELAHPTPPPGCPALPSTRAQKSVFKQTPGRFQSILRPSLGASLMGQSTLLVVGNPPSLSSGQGVQFIGLWEECWAIYSKAPPDLGQGQVWEERGLGCPLGWISPYTTPFQWVTGAWAISTHTWLPDNWAISQGTRKECMLFSNLLVWLIAFKCLDFGSENLCVLLTQVLQILEAAFHIHYNLNFTPVNSSESSTWYEAYNSKSSVRVDRGIKCMAKRTRKKKGKQSINANALLELEMKPKVRDTTYY